MDKQLSRAAAIVGLGFSELGKIYGCAAGDFAVEATRRAVLDAGLDLSAVDGLITSYGLTHDSVNIPFSLGLCDLRLNVTMQAAGATASAAIQYASMAVASGMAQCVVYVHADAPLHDPNKRSGAAYGEDLASRLGQGFASISSTLGLIAASASVSAMAIQLAAAR